MAKQKVDEYNLQLQNLRYEVLHLKKEVSRLVSHTLLPYTYTYTYKKYYLKVVSGRKDLILCHKLRFFNPYIFATQCRGP